MLRSQLTRSRRDLWLLESGVRMSTSSGKRGSAAQSVRLAACAAALSLSVVAAGCAGDNARQRQAYAYPGMVHVAPPAPVQPAPRAEIEDDGLPSQAPPMRKRANEPDDPTEPFSPNYGTMPPRAQALSAVGDAGTGPGDSGRTSSAQRNDDRPRVTHSRISTSAIAQRR
jgi:hypothetical protein